MVAMVTEVVALTIYDAQVSTQPAISYRVFSCSLEVGGGPYSTYGE